MTITTSRRAILTGFAVGPAAALIPAEFCMAAPAAKESAELLALGEQIDPLLATYRAAVARHREARANAEANCPPVPEELVCKGRQWAGCTACEADVEGKIIWPPNYVGTDGKTYAPASRNILNSENTNAVIARGNLNCDGRTQFGKQLRKLIRTAERYEAERTAAIERSGVRDTADNLSWAALRIEFLAVEIRKIEPTTVLGLQIYARALMAHAEAEIDAHGFKGRAGSILGLEIARGMMKIGTAVQS